MKKVRLGRFAATPRQTSLVRMTRWPAETKLAEGERSLVRGAEVGDSNPYALASASTSSSCVCKFRHFRVQRANWAVTWLAMLSVLVRLVSMLICRAIDTNQPAWPAMWLW